MRNPSKDMNCVSGDVIFPPSSRKKHFLYRDIKELGHVATKYGIDLP